MKLMRILLLGITTILVAHPHRSVAQAPATLSDFNNHVLTLTSAVTATTFYPASAIRFRTNRPPEFSGGLLSVYAPTYGPTNASYAQSNATQGLLRLVRYATPSDWETNNVTLNFASATSGSYSNWILRAGISYGQSNYGTFSYTAGTNITPLIQLSTASQIVQPGNSRNLSVNVFLGFDLSFQWRLNGTNLPGARTNFISLNNIQAANLGDYTCVLSNIAGQATSTVANISFAAPVNITQQPQGANVPEGAYVVVEAQATGSIQNIQWFRNGAYAAGNTNRLVFTQISPTDAGSYYVVFDNYGIQVTSQVAVVTVSAVGDAAKWLGRPFVRVAAEGMPVPGASNVIFSGWSGGIGTPLMTFRDGKVHFVAGTTANVRGLFRWSNGVLQTLVFTNTPNPLGGFFGDVYYPTDEGNGVVNFNGNSVPNGGMFAWSAGGVSNIINFNTPSPGRPYTFGGPGSFGRRGSGVALSSALFNPPGSYVTVGTGMYFEDGSTITRLCDDTTDLPGILTGYGGRPNANSVNFDGATVVFSTITGPPANAGGFFKSTPAGVITKLADSDDFLPGSTTTKFSNFADLDIDGGYAFGVANNRVYLFTESGAITNVDAGAFVSAAGPRQAYYGSTSYLYRWNDGVYEPVLNTGGQPIVDGKKVQQIVAADGQGDDVAVLLRFTDSSYGIYIVQGSAPAVPTLFTQPLDANVVENSNARFSVGASGQGTLRYQWYRDGALLNGQTGPLLTVSNAGPAVVGGYSVVVENDSGSVTSRTAQLTYTVPALPIVLSGPTGQGTATFSSNLTLTVTASGAAPLTFHWLKNNTNVLQSGSSSSLVLTNLDASSKGGYSVMVSNANGFVTSGIYWILSVFPVITQQPDSVTNLAGGTATFTGAANGIPPLTYQWQRLNPLRTITGATNLTLTLTNLNATNAGSYRLQVTSTGNGSAISRTVTLTVLTNIGPTAPLLSNPLRVSGYLRFGLPTESGYNYSIQSSTNLATTNWFTEQTIPGDGTLKTIEVSAPVSEKFIRVLAQ